MISQSSALDKKEKILEAALSLFVQFGFHGTPTSKIAKLAGVSNGTLFHYFATKEALVVALYLKLKETLNQAVAQNFEAHTDLKSQLRHMFLNSLYWGLENQEAFHFIQQFQHSPYTATISPEQLEMSAQWYINMLENGVKQGVLKPLPVDLLYSLSSAQAYGLSTYLQRSGLSKAAQHTLIEQGFELLWKMLT